MNTGDIARLLCFIARIVSTWEFVWRFHAANNSRRDAWLQPYLDDGIICNTRACVALAQHRVEGWCGYIAGRLRTKWTITITISAPSLASPATSKSGSDSNNIRSAWRICRLSSTSNTNLVMCLRYAFHS